MRRKFKRIMNNIFWIGVVILLWLAKEELLEIYQRLR